MAAARQMRLDATRRDVIEDEEPRAAGAVEARAHLGHHLLVLSPRTPPIPQSAASAQVGSEHLRRLRAQQITTGSQMTTCHRQLLLGGGVVAVAEFDGEHLADAAHADELEGGALLPGRRVALAGRYPLAIRWRRAPSRKVRVARRDAPLHVGERAAQRPEKSSGWRRSSKRVRACSACSRSRWRGRWSHGRRERRVVQPKLRPAAGRLHLVPRELAPLEAADDADVDVRLADRVVLARARERHVHQNRAPPASAAAAWRVASSSAAAEDARSGGSRS